jgi:serine/threonine-protein kinase
MSQPPDGATQRIEGEGLLAGRYSLLEKIGEGGAAEVFRARDQRLDRIVAIKILRRQYVHDQASRARFINEARSAAGLTHPNIVDVYDFGEAPDGSMFIAMQFVEGHDLKDVLQKRGRMTAAEAISIASQVCAALSAAHARGLIHRDVKPQNILIDRKGHARLSDFGIVKALSGPELTQTGMTFGTAAYISPEQATGQPISAASDVYGLGCVMYEMLAGTPPFTGDNPAIVAYKQVWEQPRPLHMLAPETPPSLERIIMTCLQKDPRARYPNTDSLAADLTALGASFNQPTQAVPVAPPQTNHPQRRQQAEVSQNIPIPPQPSAGVPPVRAQTTNVVAGSNTATPGPQVTRRVTQPSLPAPPRARTTALGASAGAGGRRGMIGALGVLIIAGLVICALALWGNNFLPAIFNGATPTPLAGVPSPTPSPTSPPSATATHVTPTGTTTPTFSPTLGPTDTVEPATETPVPTDTPVPSDTPVLPTATNTPIPITTLQPIVTSTPLTFPTNTPPPVPPDASTPTPEPAGGGGIELDDTAFVGGYTNDNGLYHGRTAHWVYGQGTAYSAMSASFTIEKVPKGQASLVIVGLDSEDDPKTPVRITLNNRVLYQGPDPLPNDNASGSEGEGNWGDATFKIQTKTLQDGINTLTITNLDPSDKINFPIFIMIDSVTLKW